MFLVGGPVRDLALDRPIADLDFVVEDRADEFAYDLARSLQASVHTFPHFLTQKVFGPGLPPIDIARARTEVYSRPGALPDVAPSTLRTDLDRRDFTINAIAFEIVTQTWIDPREGIADLDARRIRILHPASFIDDPTRMFRGIRLGLRLDFDFEPETATLFEAAIGDHALQAISRERVWRETFMAAREPAPGAVLAAFHSTGLLTHHLDLAPVHETENALHTMSPALFFDDSLDREVLMAGILLRASRDPERALLGSGLSHRRARIALEIAARLVPLSNAMDQAGHSRERFELFRRASPELRAVVAALNPAWTELARDLQRLESEPIGVRGDELGLPPGPHIGLALERTREAIFLGEISREDGLGFARAVALQYLGQRQPQG